MDRVDDGCFSNMKRLERGAESEKPKATRERAEMVHVGQEE